MMTSKFPVLDAPRVYVDSDLAREVIEELGYAEPHIPETDTWVAMPVRLVHDQGSGFHLEVGPYAMDTADILLLRRAIAAYDEVCAA